MRELFAAPAGWHVPIEGSSGRLAAKILTAARRASSTGRFCMIGMKRIAHGLWATATAMLIAGSAHGATLDTVKQRGVVNCGSNGQLPGFGLPDAQGNW